MSDDNATVAATAAAIEAADPGELSDRIQAQEQLLSGQPEGD
jgi:hypothetical protein